MLDGRHDRMRRITFEIRVRWIELRARLKCSDRIFFVAGDLEARAADRRISKKTARDIALDDLSAPIVEGQPLGADGLYVSVVPS